ncbi:MAG: hypothetical protein OEO19_03525 [Gammaproteobacteria bacterium]|nr:hypothetical protein [Gammaproteobacteria bacterium]
MDWFYSWKKKGTANCAFCSTVIMGLRHFFFFGRAVFAAAALAFLSHPSTNLAIAAARLADSLPSASARLLAARTSFFNPRTCFFRALILACNALTLAFDAELADDFFLVAGRFRAAVLTGAFLTAGLLAIFLTAAFLTAGFATFFFTAGLAAFFLTAGFLACASDFGFAAFFAVAILQSPHIS